jgi:hypothetical protein
MKLTILNSTTQEPILTLSQDDTGMQVIQGNAQNVQRLGLDRFNNLKEIADYINSDGGGTLQAVLDEKAGDPEPQNATQEDRVSGPLKVIKDLLARVEQRKKVQGMKDPNPPASSSPSPDQDQAPRPSDMEVVDEKPTMLYVSYDGDNIGNAVARAEEKDDEEELAQMSRRIEAGQKLASDWCLSVQGTIIEQGGDEGLLKVPSTAIHRVEELRATYYSIVGATLTVGIGAKISQSTKARMLGKLRGKNQVCQFDESTEEELNIKLKDQDKTEANKIRTAMRGGGDFEGAAQSAPSQQQAQQPQAPEAEQAQAEAEPQAPELEPDLGQVPQRAPKWAAPAPAPVEPSPEMAAQEPAPAPAQPLPFSQELFNELAKSSDKKSGSSIRNPYNDPELEDIDHSDADDPEFSKALHYVARYGSRKK